MDKNLKIGVNTFCGDVIKGRPSFELTADGGKNLDYAVCHFDPQNDTVDKACEDAVAVAEKFRSYGMEFIANFEFQNFLADTKCPDGYDWANRPDGTHLLNLPAKYIEALNKSGNLVSLMYDELEHCIIHTNKSIEMFYKFRKIMRAFPLCDTKDVFEQGEFLSSQLKAYFKDLKDKGAPGLCGEHVFPVFFHLFAENGIFPNFKSQKESYSNVQYAVAAGAAIEYDTELSNCVDLWYRLTNPGHSPEEMYHNLVFSYLAGSNRAYVESCHAFVENMDEKAELNDYGKAFVEFSREYKGKERGYDVHDLKPEIAIIRYDDSFWGQNDPIMWRKWLFGNNKVKPDRKSREYLKVFNILTHGETCRNGLSWGRVSPWSLRKHRSFASLNNTVVFDGKVRKEKLESLKLCFLCGHHISDETINDVASLVRENGLVAVSAERFVPENIRKQIKGSYCEIKDGKGSWIVVDNFGLSKLKKRVKPFIGNKGEIRLKFENNTVRLRISENGETFEIIEK